MEKVLRHILRITLCALAVWCGVCSHAAPPLILHTAGYESPVRGDPNDLLMIGGYGFEPTDRVVYEAVGAAAHPDRHPTAVPGQSTATLGVAPVVHIGDPPYALTVRLPSEMRARQIYRLWVVDSAGEWSDAVTINDPRPMWVTPGYVYATADFAGLNRRIRIVGRNLGPHDAPFVSIRLQGAATYVMRSIPTSPEASAVRDFVAEGLLPPRLEPGRYSVGVSRDGITWIAISGQRLEVRPDERPLPRFSLDDPAFGGCHANDGADDSNCFSSAIQAASRAGGGVVAVPAGTWDFSSTHSPGELTGDGFVLPPSVHINGEGPKTSLIVRHGARVSRLPGALLTLTGENTVSGLGFTDAEEYESLQETRPVIQLGTPRYTPASREGAALTTVDDIIISNDTFRRVGRAIVDGGLPLAHLFITRNDLGAYDNVLLLAGNRYSAMPFRIDDSVVRWNRFVPGSYLDVRAKQGTIATQLGASHRVDFSSNVADGTSTEGLQRSDDPKGWRAAFFWNTLNSHEFLLVSENHISCPGDKTGSGEAIVYDDNGNTFGFNGTSTVVASGPDWLTVRGPLLAQQDGRAIPAATYYRDHWVQVVQGPGIGQTRRIVSYVQDVQTATVTFHVSPRWDVVPRADETRIGVGRQYWQVYTVANDVDQSSPPCTKANLSGPSGGQIAHWAQTADSVIEGNRQKDTSGIQFQQAYSIKAASCAECGNSMMFQTALEIRGNTVDGEYAWLSDCSESGITGSYAASPTPESPPPVLSFGVSISHNTLSRADGFRGGAVDITSSWFRGPPPDDWPLVQNMLIFGNVIRDISGPPPVPLCRRPMRARIGIRLDGPGNIRDAVLYDNACERVDTALDDKGTRTARICSSSQQDRCECREK